VDEKAVRTMSISSLAQPLAYASIVIILVGWFSYQVGTIWNPMSYIGVILLLLIGSGIYIMERQGG
jgi:hypothetical protein